MLSVCWCVNQPVHANQHNILLESFSVLWWDVVIQRLFHTEENPDIYHLIPDYFLGFLVYEICSSGLMYYSIRLNGSLMLHSLRVPLHLTFLVQFKCLFNLVLFRPVWTLSFKPGSTEDQRTAPWPPRWSQLPIKLLCICLWGKLEPGQPQDVVRVDVWF